MRLMGVMDDDLAGRSDAEIRGLMRDLGRARVSGVQPAGEGARKLRIRLKRRPKSPIPVFEPPININDLHELTVRLPGWMIASLNDPEHEVRVALREYLGDQGLGPRFLKEQEGRMMKAKDRFTRKTGLG